MFAQKNETHDERLIQSRKRGRYVITLQTDCMSDIVRTFSAVLLCPE